MGDRYCGCVWALALILTLVGVPLSGCAGAQEFLQEGERFPPLGVDTPAARALAQEYTHCTYGNGASGQRRSEPLQIQGGAVVCAFSDLDPGRIPEQLPGGAPHGQLGASVVGVIEAQYEVEVQKRGRLGDLLKFLSRWDFAGLVFAYEELREEAPRLQVSGPSVTHVGELVTYQTQNRIKAKWRFRSRDTGTVITGAGSSIELQFGSPGMWTASAVAPGSSGLSPATWTVMVTNDPPPDPDPEPGPEPDPEPGPEPDPDPDLPPVAADCTLVSSETRDATVTGTASTGRLEIDLVTRVMLRCRSGGG